MPLSSLSLKIVSSFNDSARSWATSSGELPRREESLLELLDPSKDLFDPLRLMVLEPDALQSSIDSAMCEGSYTSTSGLHAFSTIVDVCCIVSAGNVLLVHSTATSLSIRSQRERLSFDGLRIALMDQSSSGYWDSNRTEET